MRGLGSEWWILYVLFVIFGIWTIIIMYSLVNMGRDIVKLLTNVDIQLFDIRKKMNPIERQITLR